MNVYKQQNRDSIFLDFTMLCPEAWACLVSGSANTAQVLIQTALMKTWTFTLKMQKHI